MVTEIVGGAQVDFDDPLAVASDVAVTEPVKMSFEPGNTGTPRRIARRRIIASGPAQSVRKRLQ